MRVCHQTCCLHHSAQELLSLCDDSVQWTMNHLIRASTGRGCTSLHDKLDHDYATLRRSGIRLHSYRTLSTAASTDADVAFLLMELNYHDLSTSDPAAQSILHQVFQVPA